MDNQLDKIEAKLDKLHEKLDSYSDRLVKVETSMGFIKWGLTVLITVASTAAVALSKHLGN